MSDSAEIKAIKQQQELLKDKIELKKLEYEIGEMHAVQTRGRSISVGAGCGGIIELSIRTDETTVWMQLQPIEAVELINTLAAQCGLDVATRPKDDYATWRSWDPNVLPDTTQTGLGAWQLSDGARERLQANKAVKEVRVEEPEKPLLPEETNEPK